MRALLLDRVVTAWRVPLVAACVITAAAHVPVTAEHLDEALYIGVLFIALEAVSLALALALIQRPTRAALAAVSAVGALAVVAFVWSRAVGLPLIEDDIGNWTEPLAVVSVAAEAVMAGGGALALRRPRPTSRVGAAAGAIVGTVLLVVGLPATVLAAHAEDASAGDGMSMRAATAPLTGHWSQVAGATARRGAVRTVAIAAEPVQWSALAGSTDAISGRRIPPDVAEAGSGAVCVYRQYTGTDFRRATTRPIADRYLGILGPVLHVEVGDTLRVVLLNRCGFPVSIHPSGLRTGKNDEGASYEDVTTGSQKADDAVAPGARFTYTWSAPERSGPAAGDGSSVAWEYATGAGGGAEAAGLVGVVVVTRAGAARADGSPADVDRELVVDAVASDARSGGVLHDSINGFRAGSLPMTSAKVGQRVRWYVLDSGTDAATVDWYGNTLTAAGHRFSTVRVAPGAATVADMVPDDFGWWLLDTGRPGGHARYVVTP